MPEELITLLNSLEFISEMMLPNNSTIVLKVPTVNIIESIIMVILARNYPKSDDLVTVPQEDDIVDSHVVVKLADSRNLGRRKLSSLDSGIVVLSFVPFESTGTDTHHIMIKKQPGEVPSDIA